MSSQVDTLVDFYESLCGPEWVSRENWCSGSPLRDWYGVTVDDNGHVVSIELPSNGLRGSLPGSLENLPYLKRLYLPDNFITDLPECFQSLQDLELLDIRQNMLTTIPLSLTCCPVLSDLKLSGNDITSWNMYCPMPSLKTLEVSSDQVSRLPPRMQHIAFETIKGHNSEHWMLASEHVLLSILGTSLCGILNVRDETESFGRLVSEEMAQGCTFGEVKSKLLSEVPVLRLSPESFKEETFEEFWSQLSGFDSPKLFSLKDDIGR